MKSKTPLIIVAVVIIALAGFFISRQSVSKDAYKSFTLVMNHLAGPDNWTDKGHQVSVISGTLVVNGLNFTLGDKSATATVVDINQLEIADGVTKDDLEAILATENWQDKKETRLVSDLTFLGVTIKAAANSENEGSETTTDQNSAVNDSGDQQAPGLTAQTPQLWLGKLSLKNLSLAAATADALAGPAGFIQAVHLENLDYNDFKYSMTGQSNEPATEVEIKVGSARTTEAGFTGPVITGLDSFDPSGILGVLVRFSAKTSTMENISFTILDGALTVDSLEKKDINGLGAIGDFKISGVKFENASPEENFKSITFSLDRSTTSGYDMTDYFQKIVPILAMSKKDPAQAEDLISNIQTLADFFVIPVSFDQTVVENLKLNMAPHIKLEIAEASAKGPFVAGQIPQSYENRIRGMVVTLNDDPAKATGTVGKDIFDFGQKFGQTRFEIEATGGGIYQSETGTYATQPSGVTIKDLVKMTYGLNLSGLTPERLEVLAGIPLSNSLMVLLSPEETLGDITVNNFYYKVTDSGLTDRLFNYYIATSGNGAGETIPLQEYKKMAVVGLAMAIDLQGRQYVANPEVLVKSLTDFIINPKALELSINPTPPLNVKSVMSLPSINQVLDSLNVTLQANEEETPALKFIIPGLGATGEEKPVEESSNKSDGVSQTSAVEVSKVLAAREKIYVDRLSAQNKVPATPKISDTDQPIAW